MVTEQAHSGQTPASSSSPGTGLRLGGARADFVAGLGRKVADLRAGSAKVREKPEDITLREELRRKMHALSSAAKIMKFDAMDRAIAEALGTIDRTDLDAPLALVDLDSIDQILEDLPALAWGDGDARVSRIEPVAKPAPPTYMALIVGSAQIAEALLEESETSETSETSEEPPTFGCESTPDAQAAFDLARTTEPDLVVLDADLEYATELVEALMDDPLTEGAPIVVIGSFLEPGESARYVAMGVAKTLAKPTSKATLRVACETALEARRGGAAAAQPGALPLPPHVDLAHGDRARTRLRGPATEVRLQGRKIVVADDDPAVVWFLADLLKSAGCIVHEAFDGQQALELAYRTSPDLLICDIMMPKVDGFSLCRTLRRDVALRDVPVILLSWKEDLLQRVRELGAGAAGYVRKESDTRAIVARIREALRPRAHIEMRLRDDSGEVRGRMDGISVRTLLEIVCATRPEARVSVRDASFNYEVEVRDGAPQRATRTSGDGTVLHGTKVLAAMLGVGAGRFTVVTSAATLEPQLDGNLAAQLAKPIARSRAATALLTGAGTLKTSRVHLDQQGLEDYLRAMPEIVRIIALRIAEGTSPRGLLLEGACDASLVEDLVCDLAARGVVGGIYDGDGEDLLGPEVARLAQHTDARAKYAPRTTTPVPANECAIDPAAPLCESPEPAGVGSSRRADRGAGSLEDAVMREIATRSPEPARLGEPREVASCERPSPSPPPYEHEGTPTHDQILALGEATIVDDTTYGERELSIPIDEVSISMPLTETRDARTPLTAVTTQDDATGLPTKRKAWPMVAFVAATGIVAWAVMHFALATPAAKQVETAPPAPVLIVTPGDPEGVTYTTVVATAEVPAGQGVLEISGPGDAVILVDGTDRGRGGVTLPLFAGKHDVRISGAAGDTAKLIDVRPALVAHVKF
jgi:DNA-binding response OmpR family regulator